MTHPATHGAAAAAAQAADDADAAFDFARRRAAPSLRSGLASLFHDRWRIGGVLGVGLVLTLVFALLAPRNYTAEADLLLRLGREYIYKPELGEPAGGGPVAYDLEQTLQAEARILTSRDLLDGVLDALGDTAVFPDLGDSAAKRWLRDDVLPAVGLGRLWPPAEDAAPRAASPPGTRQPHAAAAAPTPEQQRRRAAALQRFDKALDAELLKGSNLMQVRFTHRDPQVAAAVLGALIDAYLQRRSSIFASASRGTAQANFDARRTQLQAAEARLAELKRTRRIQSFGAEQSLLLAQRNALEERRTEAQLALARAHARAAALRDGLAGVAGEVRLSSETQASAAADKARALLLELDLKERDLSAQFTDDSPQVQDVRADIARTRAHLQELVAHPPSTVRSGRSPARDAAESDLLRTLADERQARSGSAALTQEQAAMDERLARLAASEAELAALERERRLAEENFNAAAKLLRDETAAAQLDRERRSNVSIVQAPRVPVAPRSLSGVILLVGTLASIGAALLVAFVSALWRDTFLTPEQAEQRLGVPVLASVQQGPA